MDSMDAWQQFFGWCTALNFGLLMLVAILVAALRSTFVRIHKSMYGLSEEVLLQQYFQYMAQYKIAILVFNFIPYIALRQMN